MVGWFGSWLALGRRWGGGGDASFWGLAGSEVRMSLEHGAVVEVLYGGVVVLSRNCHHGPIQKGWMVHPVKLLDVELRPWLVC